MADLAHPHLLVHLGIAAPGDVKVETVVGPCLISTSRAPPAFQRSKRPMKVRRFAPSGASAAIEAPWSIAAFSIALPRIS